MKQVTDSIIILRPDNFGYNKQTSVNNFFQNQPNIDEDKISLSAKVEFDNLLKLFLSNGINVIVANENKNSNNISPDAIFINNWVSFHQEKIIFIYPMYAKNRRLERNSHIIDLVKKNGFVVDKIEDISYHEQDGKYLEGTGSMVFDRQNKKIYAAISDRTNKEVLHDFAKNIGYKVIEFDATQAVGEHRKAIYHTNVMLYIGSKFAFVCLESILDSKQRDMVVDSLEEDSKEIIEITESQMNNMLGNVIELTNNKSNFLFMSSNAFKNINPNQKKIVENSGISILHSDLSTIENIGGGGLRCMVSEIFLPNSFVDA